jgi:hypothetical protein
MTEPTYQLGYTSPSWRPADPFAKEPPRKREPIGFVHFGDPEEEPRSYLDEYIQFVLNGDRDDVDELLVGFTAPVDDVI